MATSKTSAPAFPIVAVGASAGGLEAFTTLFKALPPNSGMGFVLIQHLEPTHKSALTRLLSKVTAMPVVEASEGIAVQPDHVYIIPPNKGMTIRNGTLRLRQRTKAGPHLPIDGFCFALAEDRKSAAVGILLSGTGSDGALGLKSIKAAGGITFAQEPKSAQWPIMPESAISAGAADFVMTPRRIAAELARLGRHALPKNSTIAAAENAAREKICMLLRAATDVDFRLYKQATVNRRVARRMTLKKTPSLAQYATILSRDPAEARALAEDIFIHVTGFFRNPECFQTLRKQVLAQWRAKRRPADPIRIWVPGCSTGEEVYSLAMLSIESLAGDLNATRIQMFGTDISERAIAHARAGIYTEAAVAGVSPRRLKRFFVKDRGSYQIAKEVRDLCVFARHDLARDPPFSNLDLISCRNVLIYMGPALQRRTLSVFQYALKPGGFLFLGKSEALIAYSDLFAIKNRAHRIFFRRAEGAPGHRFEPVVARSAAGAHPEPSSPAAALKPSSAGWGEAERVLLERYVPPALVVDPDLRVIHFQGETGPFLAHATGPPGFHLLKIVRPEFIVALRALISQARRARGTVRRQRVSYVHNGRPETVSLEVVPLKNRHSPKVDFMVIFKTVGADGVSPGKKNARHSAPAQKIRSLENELASTREFLQSLIAGQQEAQEETRAANEEVLSSNEELQSTNEELETAKEELQSSNEELIALNDELQHRNVELSQVGNDLTNVLAGVDIPVLVLDSGLRIRQFTPVAEKVFNLIGSDIGRPFSQIQTNLDVADWAPLLFEVSTTRQVVEREVRDRNGRWYTLRIHPYKTAGNRVDGVLIALLDIDSVKKSFEELRQSRDYAESIVETLHESLLVLDSAFRILAANRTFYRTFQVAPKETVGRLLFELGKHQWDIPELRKLLEEILPRDTHFDGFAVEREFPGIGPRQMLINARRIHADGAGPGLILLAIEDVTEKKRTEEHLRETESTVRALLDSAAQGILAVGEERKILLANRMTEKLFGYGPGELAGRMLDVLVPAECRTQHAAEHGSFFASPRIRPMGIGMDLEGCRRDGTRFPIEVSLSHIETARGKIAVAFVTDISQRKQMEEALRGQREQLDRIVATAPGALCTLLLRPDGSASMPYASAGWAKMLPEIPDLAKDATPLFAMMHPGDVARVRACIAESARTMGPCRVDYRVVTPTRGTVWMEVSALPERAPDGSILWQGFAIDATERKQAEEALRESLALLKAVNDSTKTLLGVTDLHGRYILANPTALKTFPDAIGKTADELGIERHELISAADKRVLSTGQAESLEEQIATPEGTVTILVNKSPRFDERGKVEGVINVGMNITERKKMEEAAERYQKELQTLSSRLIAAQEDQSKHLARELHDVFSQELAVLAMDISALRRRLPEPVGPMTRELEKLEQGVKSLADGIHKMSRQLHPSILDDLGLTAALQEECRMFSEMQKIRVKFSAANMPKALPQNIALCLYRVAQEILRNIAKHSGAREVRFRLTGTRGEIELSVEDVGDGFDLAEAKKKRGLGLISMEERVRIVNGVFDIQSQPGQGTKVEVHVLLAGGRKKLRGTSPHTSR